MRIAITGASGMLGRELARALQSRVSLDAEITGFDHTRCDITDARITRERIVGVRPDVLILRCGWLFGEGGRNFVAAIREQIAAGTPLRVVDDQIGTPIWTRHLAPCIAALVEGRVSGVLHAAASGQCSWHEFATSIVE